MKETDLYAPIKAFLEGQGYEVKAEVKECDVFGVRDDDDEPVIVEMKTGFSLTLFHQAVSRLAITDLVYIAVPRGKGKVWLKNKKENLKLCRRLGLGMMLVRVDDGLVDVALDPAPFTPRKAKARKTLMLREFSKRLGDPNTGGTNKTKIMTAYRQDALRCLAYLHQVGASKGSEVAKATEVKTATNIMARDHYGWFERVEKGIYGITDLGAKAFDDNSEEIRRLV